MNGQDPSQHLFQKGCALAARWFYLLQRILLSSGTFYWQLVPATICSGPVLIPFNLMTLVWLSIMLETFQWAFYFSSVGWYQRIYKFAAMIGTDLDRSITVKVNDIYAFPFISLLTTFAVLTTKRANLTFFQLHPCWRCLLFPYFRLGLDSSLVPCWKSQSLLFWALTPRYTTYPLLY